MFFNIQRWSLHDGPGIRTTLFFKGCPLRCRWCCNPESREFGPQIMVHTTRCTGCGTCTDTCPSGAVARTGQGISYDRTACTGCGNCVPACPAGARELTGSDRSTDELIRLIERDAVFYRASGGGVTFSGGEAFARPDLLRETADRLHAAGILLAAETCGYFDFDGVRDILDLIGDLFIDIKHTDDRLHRAYTGVSNRRILDNIRRIDDTGHPFTIRVPLVSGLTDTDANIDGIVSVCKGLRHLDHIELLPFHSLGAAKYDSLGLAYDRGMKPPEPDRIVSVLDRLRSVGLTACASDIIHQTGRGTP